MTLTTNLIRYNENEFREHYRAAAEERRERFGEVTEGELKLSQSKEATEMPLTKQDLEVLIDAVEAWENKDFPSHIMHSMLLGIGCTDKDQAKVEMEKNRREFEAERKSKKDRSIMLRAKLISIRDGIEASEFVDGSVSR